MLFKRVLLLEQHNLQGGFASSFVRGRFEFEVALHEMADVGPEGENKGPIRYFLKDEAGIDVEFVPIPDAYHLILTGQEHKLNAKFPFGVEAYIDAVCSAAPETPRGELERYIGLCKELYDAISYIGRSGGRADPEVLMTKFKSFLTTSGYSVADVMTKFDLPRKTLDILYPYWCYLGIPMSRLNFVSWAVMVYSFLKRGAWVPKGTSHQMTLAMDVRIRELGGQTEYNTKVEKILVEEKKLVGVETDAGDKIKTSYVISNASPHLVYGKLISPNEVPEKAHQLNNIRKLGASAFIVYVGLDAPPKDLNLESYGYFVAEHMDTDKIYTEMHDINKVPTMTATLCYNNAIPNFSPPGTCVFSSTTLYGVDVWKDITPEKYVAKKNQIAREILQQLADALDAPIFDHIEEIEIATPQTFSRYTGSFKGGIYGYDQDPWDSMVVRSQVEKKEKFIKGLEFAGGYASMGHGYNVSLLSGRQTALSVLKQMKKEAQA